MLKIRIGIEIEADNAMDILTAVKELQRAQVLVGVPGEKTPRDPAQARGSPITNAALAYIHNYGAPTVNIPPRPFMEPGIKNAQGKIEKELAVAGTNAFEGKLGEMQKSLHRAGIVAETSIKMKISTGPFPPLAPETIAARRRRGRTGTRPLIDTGQMRNAITHVVRKK